MRWMGTDLGYAPAPEPGFHQPDAGGHRGFGGQGCWFCPWVQLVKLNSGVYGGLEVPQETCHTLCRALKGLIYLENKLVLIIGQTK